MKESDAYHIDPRAVDALAAELAELRAELRQARDDNTMLRDRLHQLANEVMTVRAERDQALRMVAYYRERWMVARAVGGEEGEGYCQTPQEAPGALKNTCET